MARKKKKGKGKLGKLLLGVATGGASVAYDKAGKKGKGILKAIATGGASVIANKKSRQELGKDLVKVAKGAIKGLGKVTEIASMPVLLPFKIAMQNILKQKNVTPKKDMSDLAQQFYNIVIQKKSTFDIYQPEHIAPAIAAGIVSAIVKFFTQLKKKKEQAEAEKEAGKEPSEPLTQTEEKALNLAEASVSEVVEQAKETAKEEIATKSFMPLIITGVILAVILAVVIFAGKKKKQ